MTNTVLSCIFPLHGLHELNSNDEAQEEYKAYLNSLNDFKQSLIIFGNDSFFNCSLIFQACLSLVTTSREALFIKKTQFKAIPYPVHNMPKTETERLKLIKFRYYQTIDDLIDFLSKLHLEVNLPSVIAIDSLDNYCELDKSEQDIDKIREFSLICAHLKDAADFVRSRNSFCVIIITCSTLQNEKSFELYFDAICNVRPKVKNFSYDLVTKVAYENSETTISATVKNSIIFMDSFSSLSIAYPQLI